VESGSDEVLVFEVDRGEISDDLVLASPQPGQIAARAQVTLDEALEKLKPSLRKAVHLLKEMASETEVEFGLKIGGETGVIVAKGTAEVNFMHISTGGRRGWRSRADRRLGRVVCLRLRHRERCR
jgi:Trypsin-co-occurring domain 1